MTKINLSYVMTTYNKLPYLKEVIKRLLDNIQEDEEIVIVDGASKDGTVEFLTELYEQGKIHQFISEPDKGEAHGFNKGLLMAKGELIKLITDDDAFYYPAIQECKQFMLTNQDVEVTSGNIATISQLNDFQRIVNAEDYELRFKDWMLNKLNGCFFCGIPIMFRQNSLSKLGLFDTNFIHIDLEYSARITHLKANIAWNTSIIAVAVINENSNSQTVSDDIRKSETDRVIHYYGLNYLSSQGKQDQTRLSLLSRLINKFKKIILITKKDDHSISSLPEKQWDVSFHCFPPSITDVFNQCDKFLLNYNSTKENTFLIKK